MIEGQLVDAQGRLIGRVRVSMEGDLWSGEIDLSGSAPGIVSRFTEYEELVNGQMLSLVDGMETEISWLGAWFRFDGQQALPVEDLQVYPALQAVSFRTLGRGMTWHVYADLSRSLTVAERLSVAGVLNEVVPDGGCVGLQKGVVEEVYFRLEAASSEEARVAAAKLLDAILEKSGVEARYELHLQPG